MSFIEFGLAAYLGNIENFERNFDKEFLEFNYTEGCINRGCALFLEFSKYVLSKDYFTDYNYKTAVSCLIMNNIIDEALIEKYTPFCIWYPAVPTKETCLKLPKSMRYSVAILSILMNWEDIYNSLDIENDKCIGDLIKRFNRKFKFDYDDTKNLVDLANEKTFSTSSEAVFESYDILQFEINDGRHSELTEICCEWNRFNFCHGYPFGLNSISRWNIDNYIVNKDIKYFMFADDGYFQSRDNDKILSGEYSDLY